jgi:hypothetical protein
VTVFVSDPSKEVIFHIQSQCPGAPLAISM